VSQVITGLRSFLSVPIIYELFQRIMGAKRNRNYIIKKYFEPYDVKTILDIGCGPAEILYHLGDVDYFGFDISNEYIEYAKKHHNGKGHFYAKYLTEDDLEWLPKFDLVLMYGVLHHLDDDVVENIISLAYKSLKPEGRLLTIDAAYDQDQNFIAKYLVSKDRGRNVRTKDKYESFINKIFINNDVSIKHYRWIPYTHCIMEGKK